MNTSAAIASFLARGKGREARGDSNRNAQCLMLNVQLNIKNCALNIPWKHEIRLSPGLRPLLPHNRVREGWGTTNRHE